MSDPWDSTKSYSYRSVVTYNGYYYQYINENDDSSAGSPPNQETYSLTVQGETRTVRSWTVIDEYGLGFPEVYSKTIINIRGLPSIPSTVAAEFPSTGPKYEHSFQVTPMQAKGSSIYGIGYMPYDGVVARGYVKKYFMGSSYGGGIPGRNIELNAENPDWSYNFSNAAFVFEDGLAQLGQHIAVELYFEQFVTADKIILKMYARPNEHGTLKRGVSIPTQDMILYNAYYNLFGRKFKFKYRPWFMFAGGHIEYQTVDEAIVDSGPFKDNAYYDPNFIQIERAKPVTAIGGGFDVVNTPAGGGFEQSVEMVNRYEEMT